MSNNLKWETVSIVENEEAWVDFKHGDYVIGQGYDRNPKMWSLHFKKKWIADFLKLDLAKRAAVALMDGETDEHLVPERVRSEP